MFRAFARPIRRVVGFALALTYFVCVVGSAMALGLGDAVAAARCLTHGDHVAESVHVHADGAAHAHAQHHPGTIKADDEHKHMPGQCCGLLCLHATIPDVSASVAPMPLASALTPKPADALQPLRPDRIDRPLIALVSM